MAGSETGADRTCPSARCAPGNRLIGIKGRDGRVDNLRTPLPVTPDFARAAADHGPPEARMRFAGRCETSGCAQWTGTRCGVIDRVMGHLEALGVPLGTELPPCAIRATCRWFDQTGARACAGCAYVTTDTRAVPAE